MAKENIEFHIGTRFDGEGLTRLDKALKKSSGSAGRLASTVGDVLVKTTDGLDGMSGAVGKVGKAVGPLLSGFLSMGVWGAVIGAVTTLVGWFAKLKQASDDAALAAKGLSKEYMTLDAMAKGYQKRVESWRKKAADREKKEAEIQRKGAEADAAIKKAEEEQIARAEKLLQLSGQRTLEEMKTAAAELKGRDAIVAKVEMMKKAAALNVEEKKRAWESAKGGRGDLFVASAEYGLAKQQQKTVDAEAEKLLKEYDKQIADKIAAEKALAEKQKAELAAREKAKEAEKRIAAKKEELAKKQDEQLKAIDAQIQAAKKSADALEENAKRARGVDFGTWQRGERNLEREARAEARQKKGREDRVQRELDRLEKMNPKLLTKGQRERLAKLREWQADQDPNNNPELKRIRQLEAQRDKVRLDTLNELKMLRVDINAMTV